MAKSSSYGLGLACFAVAVAVAGATQFTVGGANGWSVPGAGAEPFNTWAERNRFQVGDSLVFVYHKDQDSVLLVEPADYNACNTSSYVKRFDDGDTVFTLDHSGAFFFISGVEANCRANEKLIVMVLAAGRNDTPPTAAAPPPASTSPPPASSATPPPPASPAPKAPAAASPPPASSASAPPPASAPTTTPSAPPPAASSPPPPRVIASSGVVDATPVGPGRCPGGTAGALGKLSGSERARDGDGELDGHAIAAPRRVRGQERRRPRGGLRPRQLARGLRPWLRHACSLK
ncbi:early nodulin-like protein 3 [Panicum miliaceum]|uniref:Early nodulin-like protein 3 n=1 Tax=Panicum miliaceum TaxID=4540 RepID=A0A3L6RT90_PANMI|nr:early nodulin-like protein 3 [Panicum miliaceum]